MSEIEIYCSKVQTKGRVLVFRVYKAHGLTRRLEVRQTMAPGLVGSTLEEQISICEEDVAEFLQGILEAVTAMGCEPTRAAKQTADQRYAEIRKTHPNAYRPWTPEEDEQLRAAVAKGTPLREIATQHGRQPSAIKSRIEKLSPSVAPKFRG